VKAGKKRLCVLEILICQTALQTLKGVSPIALVLVELKAAMESYLPTIGAENSGNVKVSKWIVLRN
jgi:hypothetical protein